MVPVPAPVAPSSSPPAAPLPPAPPRTGWHGFIRALTPRRLLTTALLALAVAALLNPIFITHFPVLVGRTLFVGLLTLVAFTAATHWRVPRVPPWVLQALAVVLTAPLATLAVYLASTGGDFLAFIQHEGRVSGFLFIAGTSTLLGLLLALGAIAREGDTEAKAMALQLALQRAQLERQAADARLALLSAQVEPHFLFNTLANVQALVETGSPRAPAVLRSLIAYLKATMPRLDEGDARLGREAALVRSYLELMHLRMPDRLRFSVDIDPSLHDRPCPPMLLLTLVENAVKHGIDPCEQGGHIEVGACLEIAPASARMPATGADPDALALAGPRLRLWVRDDGVGISESATPGTGLRNLRERLQVFHGGRARLELTSLSPQGVLAEVLIDEDLPA